MKAPGLSNPEIGRSDIPAKAGDQSGCAAPDTAGGLAAQLFIAGQEFDRGSKFSGQSGTLMFLELKAVNYADKAFAAANSESFGF